MPRIPHNEQETFTSRVGFVVGMRQGFQFINGHLLSGVTDDAVM